jgi:hypothetical protein
MISASLEQVSQSIDILDLVEIKDGDRPVVRVDVRKAIMAIEAKIKSMPGALGEDPFPLKHLFAEGVYIREVTIPKGYFVVGKLHKDSYANFILSGDMSVLTEEGIKRVKGPSWTVAPAGTKRFGYSHEDTVWATVHANPENIKDIDKLESMIHAESYEELPAVIDCPELEAFTQEVIGSDNTPFNVEVFRAVTANVFSHEKEGFWSDWTKEQQELYMSGDWEAFSRARGYTEEEILDLRLWIHMKEDAESRGINALALVKDLLNASAINNIMKDTNGEIMLSSHIPSSKKTPYQQEEPCQEL